MDNINKEITVFGQTDFRHQMRRFGIKTDDRRRHMYVIGKTGMGKTTLLENMVVSDIYAGHGLALIDPHGDFAEKVIDFVPNHRINDVVYFNPSDTDFPIGFNIFELKDESHRNLVASGLMSVFKKIWIDMWSSRMEYILNNTILALLENQGSTLLGINRLLSDGEYRKQIISNITDPVVKAFWITEFANYNDRYQQEAVAPIQNKIGQFLSGSIMRNIVAQVKSTIDIREIMDQQKIFIVNLSKGRIGEDSSRLLGGMIVTKIQLAAMERVDTDEEDRKDFFLYVDEFQNFATDSFANILSEARKYRLSLIMAHQYIEQLEEMVAHAVFGNVGTIVTFRVGAKDAEFLAKEFDPVFTEQDIVNLPKFHIYLRLMIDGVASKPFSAMGMAPIGRPTANAEKVIKVTRERYAKPKAEIEARILEWSGMADVDVEAALAKAGGGGGGKKKARVKESDVPDAERHPYKTKCWRCLKDTDVPFPPDGKRPTYCRDCYPDAMRDRQEGKPPPPVPPEVLEQVKQMKAEEKKKKKEGKEGKKDGDKDKDKREKKDKKSDDKKSEKSEKKEKRSEPKVEETQPAVKGDPEEKGFSLEDLSVEIERTAESQQAEAEEEIVEEQEESSVEEPKDEAPKEEAKKEEVKEGDGEEKPKRKRRRRRRRRKKSGDGEKKDEAPAKPESSEPVPAQPEPKSENSTKPDTARTISPGDTITFD